MNTRIYRIIILFSLAVNMLASTVSLGQDCSGLLMNYISEMESFKIPMGSKVYFMHFKISSVPGNYSTESIPDVDARMYVTGKAYFYDSNVFSIYGDSKDIIYLNHIQKQIILTNSGDIRSNQAYNIEALSKMQHELISKGRILSCKDTAINTVKCKIITLIPSKELEVNYKIKRLTYNYLPDKGRIKIVNIEYANQQTLRSQTIEYKELSFDYPKWNYYSANSVVFDNAGNVRSKYAKYSLIDNRK